MWHRVAPQLADEFALIIAGLTGYGWSDVPENDALAFAYGSRARWPRRWWKRWSSSATSRFSLAGHDRGGRVSYRLALGHSAGFREARRARCPADLYSYWERMNRACALKIYHWTFLAQPAPLPETLISGNGEFFLRFKIASQTKSKR